MSNGISSNAARDAGAVSGIRGLRGSIVAIVTPMLEDGSLDLPGLRTLIDWHVAEGTDGIVIVGTTGESPTVTVDEHKLLIKTAVEYAAGRIPMIAGAGGNSTVEAVALTDYAKQVGADATLQVVPYYNKPSQEGMFRHFSTIAERVDLPIILYNVPGRTVADMSNETILRLAQVPIDQACTQRICDLQRRRRDRNRADADGRSWQYLGHSQRCAARHGRSVPRRFGGRCQVGA